MIESYFLLDLIIHCHSQSNFLEIVTKNNLLSNARGLQTLSEEINFSKCTIGDHKNSVGKSIIMELYKVLIRNLNLLKRGVK